MMRLVTAAEMRGMDREAIEGRGIPGRELMDRAGTETARVIRESFPLATGDRVAVLCGRGNNGGDGFVVARRLREAGFAAEAYLLAAEPGAVTGDAAGALAAWRDAGGATHPVPDAEAWASVRPAVNGAALVVDAMLGTGTSGAPRGLLAEAIADLEARPGPVASIDVPSGLDADTGAVPGPCVWADLTVTMALPKRGHFLHPGRIHVGRLEVVDIGIPADVADGEAALRVDVLQAEDLLERLPERHPAMHKGDRGRLLVVGGSAGMTGAVCLAARAAVRAGAGLVTAGVPAARRSSSR